MKKLRKIIGNMIMLLGVAAGLYVGLWLMFIRPIIETAAAFDNGTITAMMVAGAILQVLLSTGTGSVIAGIGIIAGAAVKEWGE
ncbi:MAG: hypothetical protein ACLUFH_01215 [Monoglobales bacterium]